MKRRILAGLAATILLAAGCTSGSNGLESGDDYSVQGVLGEIPEGVVGDQFQLFTADVAGAVELLGLERGDSLERGAVAEWIMPLTGAAEVPAGNTVLVPVATSLEGALQQPAEFADELGWSIVDVDAFVEVDLSPRRFIVVEGDAELHPDLPEVGDGVVSAGEGDDLAQDLVNRTAARPLGAPLRMAQQDDRIAAGTGTADVRSWLDGEGPTLADDETLGAIANALDEADVLGAAIMVGYEWSPAGAVHADMAEWIPADPFSEVAIGWGAEAITLVHAFSDAAAAERALPVFERQFADGVLLTGQKLGEGLDLLEARAEGSLSVLTVRPVGDARANLPLNAVMMRDLPFIHQG